MENTREIAFFVALSVLSILFLLTLIAFILLWSKRRLVEKEKILKELENKRQIELIRAIVETEETQKTKIASDLHDQIIPQITLKSLNLNKILRELENGGNDYQGAKKEIEELANLANNVREIAHGIIPKMFTSFGLVKSIETAVKQVDDNKCSKAVFKNNTIFSGELPFSINHQLTIYRISLEILNNLYKHSNFTYLTVTLENMSEDFTLVFAHNGIGITNLEIAQLTATSQGIGLKSLQSRALSLDAEIDYSQDKDVSFISLKVPVKNEYGN